MLTVMPASNENGRMSTLPPVCVCQAIYATLNKSQQFLCRLLQGTLTAAIVHPHVPSALALAYTGNTAPIEVVLCPMYDK